MEVLYGDDARLTLRLVKDEVPGERKDPRLALWWAELGHTLHL